MRNLYINFIIVLITSLLFYLILFTYTYFDFNNQFKERFRDLESLNIHQKYSKLVHHVREEAHLDNFFKEPTPQDLVFTYLNEENKKIKVLLQGDSWFEQINGKGGVENYYSFKPFQDFGKKHNTSFINAGTSSYSPSLMNIQLDILEKDFNIKPEIVIAFIDQINIGDEICRYKKNRIYKNKKLIRVDPEREFNGLGWYNYSDVYGLSNIYFSEVSKPYKIFKLINFKFYSKLRSLKKNIYRKSLNLIYEKDEQSKKCYWAEIEKNLINPKKKEVDYFKNVLREYVKKINGKNHIKKLIFVTFPYKGHFYTKEKKIYNLNISDLVSDIADEHVAVEHVNFSKILINNNQFNFENVWSSDGIHLNSYNHTNVFIQNILKELKNHID